MKILLVSRRWYPDVIGGGQISAHKIAQALIQAGVEVRALTFVTEGGRKDEVIDGVPVTRLPIRKLKLFPRFSNLEWMYREMKLQTFNFLKEWTPDVIHAMNGESVPSIAAVSRKTGIPFIAAINGPSLVCFPGEGTDRFGNNCLGCKGRQRFSETILRWNAHGKIVAFLYWLYSYPHMAYFAKSIRAAKLIVCPSNGLKPELVKLGYAPEIIRPVHNPIEIELQPKTNLKQELGIPHDAKVLLYAGRLSESKGIQNLVAVLPDFPQAHLVVVGKGMFEAELRKQAQALDVTKRVHFIGFINNDLLGPYYAIANIVAMAGTFYEFLGRMLMEASTYSVPAIGTNIGGIPDVIEDGKNGFLLQTQDLSELREKIKRILDSPALEKQMGAYGQEKMRREFSPKSVAQALIRVYEDAVTLK